MKDVELRCAVCGKVMVKGQNAAKIQLGVVGPAGVKPTEVWGYLHNDVAPFNCLSQLSAKPADLMQALKDASK